MSWILCVFVIVEGQPSRRGERCSTTAVGLAARFLRRSVPREEVISLVSFWFSDSLRISHSYSPMLALSLETTEPRNF